MFVGDLGAGVFYVGPKDYYVHVYLCGFPLTCGSCCACVYLGHGYAGG